MADFGTIWPKSGAKNAFVLLIFRYLDLVLSEFKLLGTPATQCWNTCFDITSGGKLFEHVPSRVVEETSALCEIRGDIQSALFFASAPP
jgi:hypothetical protein